MIVSVIVSIDLRQLTAAIRDLQDNGLNIHQVLDDIGVIIGDVEEGYMTALATVSGVYSVERERDNSAF